MEQGVPFLPGKRVQSEGDDMIDFNGKPLFILEMANNHMGDVSHAMTILHEFHKVTTAFPFNFSFKLQHRSDGFFHPDYRNRKDLKYIKRFTETKLSIEEFKKIKDEICNLGYIPMCTPWDEESVDLMEELDFAIIKIASCSFIDWPLLERVIKTNRPIIASSAGASLEDIDRVVAFFQHRHKNFCLMHCVGAYPTKNEQLQLNQIDLFKTRYPKVPVGFSTHESPLNLDSVKIAIGKGVMAFEKHVGVPTQRYQLNAYSATPDQVRAWLLSAQEAYAACGVLAERMNFGEQEKADLIPLFRGVFAGRDIAAGEKINKTNTFYAMPNIQGQVLAREISKYSEYIALQPVKKHSPVMSSEVQVKYLREKATQIVNRVKNMLKESKTIIPNRVDMEISCHYGIDRFEEWGAVIIKVVNREYCKMHLVLFPGQKYPLHHHKLKEESLLILFGDLTLTMEGYDKGLCAGDIVTVERGADHSFSTKNGVIIEEISTTYYKGDSYYKEEAINKNPDRKVELTYWVDT